MATKKECDRCGKQWVPGSHNVHGESDTYGGDGYTCTIIFSIPKKPHTGHYESTQMINQTIELCQDCARAIHNFAKEAPPSADTSR